MHDPVVIRPSDIWAGLAELRARHMYGVKPTVKKSSKQKKEEKKEKKRKAKILDHPINFVTGSLGSGKSYYAQRYVFKYLAKGRVVACNFDLVGEWWKTAATQGFVDKYLVENDKKYLAEKVARDNTWRFDVLDELYEYRLPGTGEDLGLLILDEGALQMNTREYSSRAKADKEKYDDPLRSLAFYINMRKRGWSMLMLTHHQDQLDNQLRHMGGQIIRLRNLARIKMPFIGIPMAKKDRFVAVHIDPSTKPALRTKVEVYGLDLRIANHYRSQQEFAHAPDSRGMRLQAPFRTLARPVPGPHQTWDAGGRRPATTRDDRGTREDGGVRTGSPRIPWTGGDVGGWRDGI